MKGNELQRERIRTHPGQIHTMGGGIGTAGGGWEEATITTCASCVYCTTAILPVTTIIHRIKGSGSANSGWDKQHNETLRALSSSNNETRYSEVQSWETAAR